MQGNPFECPLPAGSHASTKMGHGGNGPAPLSRDNLTRNSASLTGVSEAGLLLPEACSSDSWVEVSSRPSTSSMSSSSAADEEGMVTMGLRVLHSRRQDRRRKALKGSNRVYDESTTATEGERTPSTFQNGYQHEGHEDGDDNEHETSSSDSDHAMSSSTEDLASPTSRDIFFLSRGNSTTSSSASASVISSEIDEYDNDDDDDDDMDEDDSDDETALGPTNPSYTHVEGFRPRPHAFSQFTNPKPESSTSRQQQPQRQQQQQQQRRGSRPIPTSRISSQTVRITGARPLATTSGPRLATSIVSPSTTSRESLSRQQPQQHHIFSSRAHPYAPRNQDDHDAALRASLSTLLSCARGLSSGDVVPQQATASPNAAPATAVIPTVPAVGAGAAPAPGALRLVPESIAMARRAEEDGRTGGRAEPKTGTRKDGQVKPPPTPSSRQQSPSSTKKRSAPPSAPRSSSRHSKRRQSPSSSPKRRRTSSLIRARTESGTTAHYQFLSPSLLSYLVGAGAIIVFSALSFSAGYVLGRRVGRFESCSFTGFETGSNTSTGAASVAAAATAGAGLRDAANEEVRSAVRGIGRGCRREAAKGIWELSRFGWLGAGTGITEVASA